MKWYFKFIKSSLFGMLPFQEHIRQLKRKISPYPSAINEWTLKQGCKQVEMLHKAGVELKDKTLLEIGTGWQPIIPIVFRLAGCGNLILIDNQKLLDVALLIGTCQNLKKYSKLIATAINVSEESILKSLDITENLDLDAILQHFCMQYYAPYDYINSKLEDASIDIVTSRAVLEHIPPNILKKILEKSYKLLKSDGKMCHVIDNSDHWGHDDKSISTLNFLRYSKKTFDFISSFNPLDYQNRLRHCEYIDMMKRYGFHVILDDSKPDEKSLRDVEHIHIHENFKHMPKEQLAILTSYLVLSK